MRCVFNACDCACRGKPLSRQEISAGSVEILSFPLGDSVKQEGEDAPGAAECFGLSLKVRSGTAGADFGLCSGKPH